MENKKIITRNNLLWGIWCFVLIILTATYTVHTYSFYIHKQIDVTLFRTLCHIIQTSIMPYIIITLFYIIACSRKDYSSMLYMLGIDLASLASIIYFINTLYEGPHMTKVSVLIILINILTKGCLAFSKR